MKLLNIALLASELALVFGLGSGSVRAATATDRPFVIEQVSPHVYAAIAQPHGLVSGNVGIVVFQDYLLLVDSTDSPISAHALRQQIRAEISTLPIRYVVNTHAHLDHARGNREFVEKDGAIIIGSTATLEELRRSPDDLQGYYDYLRDLAKKLDAAPAAAAGATLRSALDGYLATVPQQAVPTPSLIVDQQLRLADGQLTVEIRFLGRGHTTGDLVVYIPEEGVIFTGDLMHGFEPLFGAVSPEEWLETLEQASRLKFSRIVPGHGSVETDRNTFRRFQDYIRELSVRVRAARQDGKSLDSIQRETTLESVDALSRDGLAESIEKEWARSLHPVFRPQLRDALKNNIRQLYEYYGGELAAPGKP